MLAHALSVVYHAQGRRIAPFSYKRPKPRSHLCTRGDPTVALSNHPSSLSVGNTSPRVEVYSPIGGKAMIGGVPLVHPARPRAALRGDTGAATNAEALVHDARRATAAEDASMISETRERQRKVAAVFPCPSITADEKGRGGGATSGRRPQRPSGCIFFSFWLDLIGTVERAAQCQQPIASLC